ncbi:MAG TPA: hypothetical protein VI299_19075 [Polyangiales bacterium]
MFRWRIWLGRTAVVLLAASSLAKAQAPSTLASAIEQNPFDSPEYADIIHEALAEFQDGHFAEARALFLRAHNMQPSARTLRGLGVSSFALRQYDDATLKLELALASTVKPLEEPLLHDTQVLLERAHGFVGRYQIGLNPNHAQLFVDGAEVETRAGERLLLTLGRHSLEARAPAHEPEKRTVDVAGGENTALTFTLTSIPIAPIVATPTEVARVAEPTAVPTATDEPRRPVYKNPWLWAGVSAAVAAIVIGVSVAATRDHASIGAVGETDQTPANGVIKVP